MKLGQRVDALEALNPSEKIHVIQSGNGYLDEAPEIWAARDAAALANYGIDRVGPGDRTIYVHGIGVRGSSDPKVTRTGEL